MAMSYHKHSRYTSRSNHNQHRENMYASKHTKQLCFQEQRYSRYANTEEVQPRRRRWAAGYIDRHSCPSYAYIDIRARSPKTEYPSDTEYIAQPKSRKDSYIQQPERYDRYTDRHATYKSDPRHSGDRSPLSNMAPDDDHCHRRVDSHDPCYRSDIEDLDLHHHHHTLATRSQNSDSETGEGSDIVIVKRGSRSPDVASIHSRRSSNSRSDRRSTRSMGARSDVQERRKRESSESDDEGGYISLEDYIAGRSDCVSNKFLSEDDGEGSDAVGSDVDGTSEVGEGSDVADGSDVASLSDRRSWDDEEDCIDYGHEDYIGDYRR